MSASRQVEDLICTYRESLIGSGAWNAEFCEELQTRPFYHAHRCTDQMLSMLCKSSSGYDDDHSGIQDPERCAACHRTKHQPDTQVIVYSI